MLRAARDDALAGEGRLVLVAGEAGVGKTALLRSFCGENGASVRWGACDPMFAPRPLGPFLDVGGELASLSGPHEIVDALVRAPGVLVLEDLHWADEATLDTLRLLARKVAGAPLLVVASYRDDELDRAHPLRIVVGEVAPSSSVVRLDVPRLSREAVGALAVASSLDADELYRLTSGNPFYVTEAIAAGGGVVPASVRDAVLARAARLSPGARSVLDVVAIAPPRVELWLLEELAGERIDAVSECVDAAVLTASDTGVEFRHELARLAIEETIEPLERRRLHRATLAALASPPFGEPDVVRLSHHADSAEDADAVLVYAPEAAERATAVGAHREAAAHLARALRYEQLLHVEERADLLKRYADASYLTDRCYDAIDAAERMLACYRSIGDSRSEGRTLTMLSALQMCPMSVVDAEPAGVAAVELLETLPAGPELAEAYANLAAIAMNREDLETTRLWGRRAIELSERFGDRATLAHALNSLGMAEFLRFGPEHRRDVELSLTISLDARLEIHVLRAYSNMAWAAWRHRDYTLAERYLVAGLARCSAPDFDLWRLQHCAQLACVRLEQDRWDEAVESARLAIADPRSSPLPRILGQVVIGLVRARRGDPHARPLLDDAAALAKGSGELQRIGPAAAARAEAAWLARDPDGVDDATSQALALARERGASWFVGHLLLWRHRAGLDESLDDVVPAPYANELAGRHQEAAQAWDELGCGYEAALALAFADGEAELRNAHERLVALGARPASDFVARRLRERGVRGVPRGPRPRTRRNPAELTDRELDVLRLLGDGLRNSEIASRLVLSTRTVDHHVSAVLRKLSAEHRGEAVAEARRRGVLP